MWLHIISCKCKYNDTRWILTIFGKLITITIIISKSHDRSCDNPAYSSTIVFWIRDDYINQAYDNKCICMPGDMLNAHSVTPHHSSDIMASNWSTHGHLCVRGTQIKYRQKCFIFGDNDNDVEAMENPVTWIQLVNATHTGEHFRPYTTYLLPFWYCWSLHYRSLLLPEIGPCIVTQICNYLVQFVVLHSKDDLLIHMSYLLLVCKMQRAFTKYISQSVRLCVCLSFCVHLVFI
jgi:hypothetical protein